jgi:hypothetical protein
MRRVITTVLGLGALAACFMGGDNPDGGVGLDAGDSGVLPFQADTPFTYVAKVKDILTGLAPTQAEVDAVVNAGDATAQQAALVALIDAWTDPTKSTPEVAQYELKMRTFFELAFQQTQLSQVDFTDMVPNANGGIGTTAYANLLIQNVKESFARTVYELVIKQGKPLSSMFTTDTFMMTTALEELYAFMDWNAVGGGTTDSKIVDKFAAQPKIASGGVTVIDTTTATLPYSQTIDPASSNYMHWAFKGLSTIQPTQPSPDCQVSTRTWISTNNNNVPSAHLVHYLMYGALDAYKINGGPPPNNNCNAYQQSNANAVLDSNTHFSDWHIVKIVPAGGGAVTPFWDLTKLVNASTLSLAIPRIGFFSTPAFHANWSTNTSNQMRVTINQAFIVALGAQVDGTDMTDPQLITSSPPGIDPSHTPNDTTHQVCFGCHRILDPSRSILLKNWSDAYGVQTSPNSFVNTGGSTGYGASTNGWFIFNGVVNKNINSLTDFGNALASHAYYSDAWIQKLCFFANSQKCDPTDPEFDRVRQAFKKDGSWRSLVEALMSSPIITNAVATQTEVNAGELVSVARRDHLCTALNARLQQTDLCGLDVVTTKTLVGIPEIAAGLPSDGYGRGAAVPVLPVAPSLFYRTGLENICEDAAMLVIDPKTPLPPVYWQTTSQQNVDTAISDFVTKIMAIVPDDPRYQTMLGALTDHYTSALAVDAGVSITKTDALKSTFVTACLSPNVAGIGM